MESQVESGAAAIGIVEGTLRSYADRGVFQDFQMAGNKAGADFHFGWLHNQPFTLSWDWQRKRLTLVDLLPGVQRDSLMHKELKAFLSSRSDADVPEHRRVDPARATLVSRMRGGVVSLELTLAGSDYEYGARKLINIGHEVFLFLGEYWADYMWENFQLSME
jgi:hypothetical protein